MFQIVRCILVSNILVLMKKTYLPAQGDEYSRTLVNHLIGIEMSNASFINQCCEYWVANSLVFRHIMFQRHSVAIVKILERLSALVNTSPASISDVSELVEGSNCFEVFKINCDHTDENIATKAYRINAAITQFIETANKEIACHTEMHAICQDILEAHKKMSLELSPLAL